MHGTTHHSDPFVTAFQDFQDHFQASDTGIALVGGSIFGCLLLMGPAVALVVTKIGYKWTGWLGALISIGSMVVCYFTDNFTVFQTCYGFLMGLGFSFLYLPSTTCGTFYFKERRALVTRYITLQIIIDATLG